MRTVTLIVVHCSANRADSALRLADIDHYHRSLGWKGCGYHYVVATDGTVEAGRKEAEGKAGGHTDGRTAHGPAGPAGDAPPEISARPDRRAP